MSNNTTIPPVLPVTPVAASNYRLQDKILNLYSINFFIGDLNSSKQNYEGTATVLAFHPDQAEACARIKIKHELAYLFDGTRGLKLFISSLPIAVGCKITSVESKKGY